MRRVMWRGGWSPALVALAAALAVAAALAGTWSTVLAMVFVIGGQLLALTAYGRRRRARWPNHKYPDDF